MIGQPWRIIFFGSDAFSITFLKRFQELLAQNSSLGLIKGIASIENSLVDKLRGDLDKVDLEKEEFDVGIVASFGKFIPGRVIRRAATGMLNVHPSILPEWRGPAPIQRSIMHGSALGVSIIDVHPKVIDSGDIYLQKKLRTDEIISFPLASEKLAQLGAEMMLETLINYERIKPMPQVGEPTYAAPISNQDSQISFKDITAEQIYRTFLAISHQETLKCQLTTGRELLIKLIKNFESETDLLPGEAVYDRHFKALRVGTNLGEVHITRGVIKGKSTVLNAGGIVSALKGLKFL